MVERINGVINNYSYNIAAKPIDRKSYVSNRSMQSSPSFASKSLPAGFSNNNVSLRTELSSKSEKKKYKEVSSKLDRSTRKMLEGLLKNGILLNNKSEDNSTVLDNLHRIIKEPRANGLKSTEILKDTITTIAYPYFITQQFGDIPPKYRQAVVQANNESKSNLFDIRQTSDAIDVEHSGTCVAASTEFKLAKQLPAEFARFAQGLSSENMEVTKSIKLEDLADNTLSSVWLLNAFEIPFEMNNFNEAVLKFKPDKNAILRAQIQTTDKDPDERTPLDVLMQSTFMQIGSQQSYNTLTDKRGGKFNQNDKGLIEFEKTFTESVVFGKNILSVTYQTVDENARLVGYETDLNTMRRHLINALNIGENVIIGYTQTNDDNIIVNGHEITIVGYKTNGDGKITFICNDTDDDLSKPIEYSEDYLLPKIHHAALPKDIVESDLNIVPSWIEGINMYKQMKNCA